jgi:hypothetical protein
MNRILVSFLIASSAMTAFAQGATNSPYSQFGLGEIAQQGSSLNRGMDGLGIALHQGNQVNTANPASYAYVDSLTMLFDMGLSASLTHFEENGVKKNARTGNFEYALGSFRLSKNVGATFGVLPVTNVGYDYYSSRYMSDMQSTMLTSYTGDGGLQKLIVGLGARVGNLSAGFNVGYLWGGYNHSIVLSSSTAVNNLTKKYQADVSSYVLDFGLQYDLRLSKKDKVTLGATYGLGHKLNADATCDIINSNSTISKADSTHLVIGNALELPHTFGVGLAYTHQNTLTIGVDGTMQRWGELKFPKESEGQYQLASGMLKDAYKMTVGTEWVPRYNSRRLIDRIKYRIGASYMTPYYKIGTIDGPKQYSVSAGFGIPIQNQINARSYVNISGQWVKQSVDGLLKENTFRINVGVTFNERWFAKWKVE